MMGFIFYLYANTKLKRKERIAFKGHTHILLSVALTSVIASFLFPFDAIPLRWYIYVGIGSIIADIDHPYSLIGRYNIAAAAMTHRGFTHTLPCLIIVSLLVYLWYPAMGLLFAFGYFTHLLGDCTTKTGIAWLYPYKNKKYSLNIEGAEMFVFGISLLYLWKK